MNTTKHKRCINYSENNRSKRWGRTMEEKMMTTLVEDKASMREHMDSMNFLESKTHQTWTWTYESNTIKHYGTLKHVSVLSPISTGYHWPKNNYGLPDLCVYEHVATSPRIERCVFMRPEPPWRMKVPIFFFLLFKFLLFDFFLIILL